MTEDQTERLLALMEAIDHKLTQLLAAPSHTRDPQPPLNETDRAFYDRLYGMYP